MSGFGGFGSPQPPAGATPYTAFAFGSGQPNQPPTMFGNSNSTGMGGGGSGVGLFGSTTVNPFGISNGSGFGANQNPGMSFGSPLAQPSPTSFGTPAPFGGGNQLSGAPPSSSGSTPFGTSTTSTFGTISMSTIGSTFGAAPTTAFGAQTNMPTSSFGGFNAPAASTPFANSSMPSLSAGFGTSFGSTSQQSASLFSQPSNTLFGTNTSASSTIGLGTTSFGNSGGFGTNSTTSSGFGSNTTPNSSLLGNSGFGNTGFGSSSTNAFAPSTNPGFGQQLPSAFGLNTNTSTPFGGSQGTPFGSSTISMPFGSNSSSSQFGQQGQTAPSAANATTPFGATAVFNTSAPHSSNNPFSTISSMASVPPSGATFGAPNSNMSGFGFSSSMSNSGGFSFGTNNNQSDLEMRSSPIPYGISPQSMSPMKGQSDSEDMGDGEETNARPPLSNLPFGRPVSVSNTFAGSWDTSSTSNNPFSSSATTGLATIPESEISMDSGAPYSDNNATTQTSNDEALATLKAKIEQKKKKLEEKRRKEEANDSKSSSPVPSDVAHGSLAERNAIRFATKKIGDSKSHLPSDLIPKEQADEDDANPSFVRTSGGGGDRGDLENAVSLIGTCMSMCPDEEIMRREREGDIQLLEKPMPGTMHPASWTLRDTMVKRFRRSAADYKLDVPEWVRPPDVLERVCGYLEEWVMERDRQGKDQRFVDSAFNFKEDGTPPPLDVYQFIWDRTRMVRKDFILQNYVGTGGKCDARAVRCHERIARWHAMVEHQLSHVPEFVTKQSQQNIQELGQTMKTLNQYYDDSLNRSTVEVPDEQGKETRLDLSNYNHGCLSNSVQGPNPIDFNSAPLINDENLERVQHRLIGSRESINSSHHGTAEPEMRGLYILLTLENDGGMEVLKYAARLFQTRPAVYHSVPVQLALSIYKARKEYNYARFFSILRKQSTPYLFACIMFKYVESMRKFAFKIMSKTYGGKSRENEPIHDAYPLKHLTELLCFEDDDETRVACKHFNITVKNIEGSETIFWRQSSFKDPKDPEKDTIIRLQPRKMMRTIESKVHGVTRLAVCRGEASGEGAYNASSSKTQDCFSSAQANKERLEAKLNAEKAALAQLEIARMKKEEETLRRRQEEIKRAEREKRKQEEIERRKLEDENRRLELERQQKRERAERDRLEKERIAIELERRKQEEELDAARKAAEAAEIARQLENARIEKLRLEAEERVKQEKLEEERKRRQAEEEQYRLQLELQQKHEAERKVLEMENMRQEQERLRVEAFIRAEEARKKQAVDALRRREEANDRILLAKKKILLLRWMRKLPRHVIMEDEMRNSLKRISPREHSLPSPNFDFDGKTRLDAEESSPFKDLRRSLERGLKKKCDLSRLLAQLIWTECNDTWRLGHGKVTLLFSVAIVLPVSLEVGHRSFCDLVRTWIEARLGFREVTSFVDKNLEVRVNIFDSSDQNANRQCDACCFVVPPPWSVMQIAGDKVREIEAMASSVADDIPRVVFALHDLAEKRPDVRAQRSIAEKLCGSFDEILFFENNDVDEEKLDKCLLSVCELVAKCICLNEPTVIQKTTFERLAVDTLCEVLHRNNIAHKPYYLVKLVSESLHFMFHELTAAASDMDNNSGRWPCAVFADHSNCKVENYFCSGSGLPLSWASSIDRRILEPALRDFASGLNGKLPDVIRKLIRNAPYAVLAQCQKFLDIRDFTCCLQHALLWKVDYDESNGFGQVIYVTKSLRIDVIQNSAAKCAQVVQSRRESLASLMNDSFSGHTDFLEDIDPPPNETPVKESDDNVLAMISASKCIPVESELQNAIITDRNEEILEDKAKKRQLTDAQLDSLSFTKRLKRLVAGQEVKDMIVGKTTLGAALRSAPPVTLPNVP